MNKTTSNVSRGQSVGRVQDRLSKRYEFEAKYLCDNDQTEPVRILFGRDCLTTTQLVPIFNLKEVKKKSSVGKGGKGGSSTQTEYYGGLAFSVCVGEVDKLYRIYNADDQIFYAENGLPLTGTVEDIVENNVVTGSLIRPYNNIAISADGSDYGTLRFYSGVEYYNNGTEEIPLPPDQAFHAKITLVQTKDAVNDEINVIPADCTPAFKGICYFASDSFRYGTSNSVPNLRCEVQCQPKIFFEDVDVTSGLTLEAFFEPNTDTEGTTHTSHSVVMPVLDKNGDTYIPLVIYEILRNKTWGGAGLSKDDIDIQSFIDALHICFNEHNVVSPCIDSSTSIRDAISQCLEYVDGVLVLENDLITLKLIRRKDTPISIGTAALVEEPRITWSGADDTWGVTKVSFNERINSYESTSEVFESPLYNPAANFGVYKTEDYDLPWIKTRYVAAMLARRLGHVGAVPDCEATLTVLPSAAENITCGSLISLTYEKLNIKNLILRVNEITLGKPEKPSVELKCVRQVLTDWEIDSDVFSKYMSRFTRQELISPLGGYFTPRVLPVYYKFDKAPVGFYCFLAKNPDCPTSNLIYSYVSNKKIKIKREVDGNEVEEISYNGREEHEARVELDGEISGNFKGGYSVFGVIDDEITVADDLYKVVLTVDKTNYDFYDELKDKGDLYIGTCAYDKNGQRQWVPVFWRVEEVKKVGGNKLECKCWLNLREDHNNEHINKNYYSVFFDKYLPSKNAYLFLDGCLFFADSALRYDKSWKYRNTPNENPKWVPFIDAIFVQACFSKTKEVEDQTTAGRFVLARYHNRRLLTLANKKGIESTPEYDILDVETIFDNAVSAENKREINYDDAWGGAATIRAGSVVFTTEAVASGAAGENTGDTLIYCTGNGNIYNSIGEVIGTFDNSAYITELDHAVSYPDDNDTLTVIRGKDNIIILNITDEDQSYSLSADMMEGDYLRIITMTDSDIPSDTTCTVYPPEDMSFILTNGDTVNSVLLSSGTTLELFCVRHNSENAWLAVLNSSTKIKNENNL